jgi:hypothetical protein
MRWYALLAFMALGVSIIVTGIIRITVIGIIIGGFVGLTEIFTGELFGSPTNFYDWRRLVLLVIDVMR